MGFGKKEKLSPRQNGPFEILKKVGEMAYRLALPSSLSGVHLVFHVSILWNYYSDSPYVLDFSSVQLDKDLTYVEEPVATLDTQVQNLRSKNIVSVKVQWRGPLVKDANWQTEHDMWRRYPHLLALQ
uniref:Uncharacterized protein LOC104233684 n=1 Tax=Nicotiana sylvestris TaxID=4096 RepID=A0A1U7WZT7_NICSY